MLYCKIIQSRKTTQKSATTWIWVFAAPDSYQGRKTDAIRNHPDLRVGSKITWHSGSKMSSPCGTFANSLCQVIFVRSLNILFRRMITIGYPFQKQDMATIMDVLSSDGTMVFPTETFYAIGCLATSSRAVEKIYSLKQREKDAPLLVLVDSWWMLEQYTDILSLPVREMLARHWPGALTAILKHQGNLADMLNQAGETLGFRMTSSAIARELVNLVNTPLVGTSANISNGESTSQIERAQSIFGDQVDLYIDGGDTPGGLPSTIVDLSGSGSFQIIRQGSMQISNGVMENLQ